MMTSTLLLAGCSKKSQDDKVVENDQLINQVETNNEKVEPSQEISQEENNIANSSGIPCAIPT